MGDYREDLKCTKVIDKQGNRCNISPTRKIEILNECLCKKHQQELSDFIRHQLGED